MPLRNLIVILVAAVFSFACYQKTQHNRYASSVAEAIDLVESYYVEDVDSRSLFENAMRGMVQGLDQYSAFIGPEDFRRMEEDLDQEFGGVGVEVAKLGDDQPLVVLSPLIGTPAQRAGLRAGDEILAIDGESTIGMTRADSVKKMRGKPGSEVVMSVKHFGEEQPRDVKAVREVIMVYSVKGDTRKADGSWDYHLKEDPRIAYLRIGTFGQHTAEEIKEILSDPSASPPYEALIIDLRDNAGGLLESAVQTCDAFIREGVIVSTRGRDGSVRSKHSAHSTMVVDEDFPIVVLVNGLSASASEIVAACLQDYGRAVVIGDRTWGKGTVQNVLEMEGGRSALKLTTASYWRPSGRNIHRRKDASEDDPWGVTPDEGFVVKLEGDLAKRILRKREIDDLYPGLLAENPALIAAIEQRLDDQLQTGEPNNPNDVNPPNDPSDSNDPSESHKDSEHADRDETPITPPETSNDTDPEQAASDDDPQLRRAIDYLEQQLRQHAPTTAKLSVVL